MSSTRQPLHAYLAREAAFLSWFAHWCRTSADRVALVSDGGSTTYAQLDRQSLQIARRMAREARSSSRPPIAAFLLHDRKDLIPWLLGTFRAGWTFSPLDADWPETRLAHVMADLGPALLVVSPEHQQLAARLVADQPCAIWVVDDAAPPVEAKDPPSSFEQLQPVDPDAPAYIYFSSGSTGRPKGITGRQRSLSNFIRWEIETLALAPGCRFSQLTTPTFDAFFRDVLVPLCAGGTICLPPGKPSELETSKLLGWLSSESIEIIHCVPSLFATLLEGSWSPDRFANLRYILQSGEVLHVEYVRRFRELMGDRIKLFNLYGASEATMIQLYHEITNEDLELDFIPIGRPIDGVEAILLDESGKPSPAGETGELYLRSDFLTLGYHNDPDLTRKVFLEPDESGTPMYKTGDRARLLEGGALCFVGRSDRLIKVRGIRVEPADIEAVIAQHPEVTANAVVWRVQPSTANLIAKQGVQESLAGPRVEGQLIAYLEAQISPTDASLRSLVADNLPGYMIPARFVVLDKLPRLSNGKLDLKSLPAVDSQRPPLSTPYLAPQSPTQHTIADIWQQVLGIERIGIRDSFFELGGNSLQAMQALNRMRRALRARLGINQLFELQTIEELALAASTQDREPEAGKPALTRAPERAFYPLSEAQRGLWFLWKMDRENPFYTTQGNIHLKGPFELETFQRAWRALLERHEILRVRFGVRDETPVQFFDPPPTRDVDLEDLSQLSQEAREQHFETASEQELLRSFDLERGSLVRYRLFKFSDTDHVVCWTAHEITIDLWSIRVLMRDLSELYEGFRQKIEEPLSPLQIGLRDCLIVESEPPAQEALASQELYWREILAGTLPVLELPLDHPRPRTPSYRGQQVNTILNLELSRRIRSWTQREGTTMFMTLLTAYMVVLHKYTGQEEIIVGAPFSNRGDEAKEHMVGFFLNMLPLRSDVSEDPSFRSLLGGVRTMVTGAIAHADYPFMRMAEWAKAARDTSASPVFQVMFNMLSFTDVELTKYDLSISYRGRETGYTKYDISMYAQEFGERIFLQFSYLSDLFEHQTMERMLANLETLLSRMLDAPDTPLSQLDIISANERRSLLASARGEQVDFGAMASLTQIFERQVRASPESIAYRCSGASLSYDQLDRRANQISHDLIARGAGHCDLVALYAGRSFQHITTLLGILKAGAAYIVLDPDYPAKRNEAILRDARPRLLLTEPGLPRWEGLGIDLHDLDLQGTRLDALSEASPGVHTDADDLFMLVYTSSTTGAPKGVEVPIRAVLNRLHWMWKEFPFNDRDVALLQKSTALVASTWELFGALLMGRPTLILSREEVLDPSRLWAQCLQNEVSYLLATPALLDGLLEQAEAHPGGWPSLRLATTSAEPLSPAMVDRWRRAFPDVPLLNLYGSTECSSNVTVYDTSIMDSSAARVPIGRPISNVQVHILDPFGQSVPQGVVGEMYVSGACVAKGYNNLPELTRERFTPNPFKDPDGPILYGTGDLVRHRHDATLELMGRIDNQIKLRGFRIDPGDVESVVNEHPYVSQCVVVASGVDLLSKRLVAYIVPSEASEASAEGAWITLQAHLRRELPDYMVPSEFVRVAEIPRTPNGKLDRKKLVPLELAGDRAKFIVQPRTEFELRLKIVWERLLDRNDIGVTDNFFDMGGHSLLAIRLSAAIEKEFNLPFPLPAVFNGPTIEQAAHTLQNHGGSPSGSAMIELRQGSEQGSEQGGSLPPLFCICGIFIYQELATSLDTNRAVYAIYLEAEFDALLAKHGSGHLPRVEEFARDYVAKIQEVQPQGPYHLIGVSFGGTLAYEVARQLRAQGQAVVFLAILDTSRGNIVKRPASQWLRHHLSALATKGPAHITQWIEGRLSRMNSPLAALGSRLLRTKTKTRDEVEHQPSAKEEGMQQDQDFRRARRRAYLWASAHYNPPPCPGKMVLFRAIERPKRPEGYYEDPLLGWGPLCIEGLEVHHVPGDHLGMLRRPNVEVWAKTLSDYLR